MSERVVTPVFEGPVDLLLHLVNTHEVDVLDVPLAPVVDAFVAEVAGMVESGERLELGRVSEFLLIAAILVELKSRRLLPEDAPAEEDEELEGWDSRDVLLSRLLECRAYAAAGEVFAALLESASRSVPREAGLDDGFVVHAPDLLEGVSAERLADAYKRAMATPAEPRLDLSHVTVDTVTVAEAVHELAGVLPNEQTTTFRSLTGHLGKRMEVIVRFLALLELCKLGKVSLGQGRTFGDLSVTWTGGDSAVAPGADSEARELTGVDAYDG